jgi:hypothetical protein
MSWFSRLREFKEGEDIVADDFETEFDGIASALNTLIKGGQVDASGPIELLAEQTGDVPGAVLSLVLTRSSVVQVVMTADAQITAVDNGPGPFVQVAMVVDGAPQSAVAKLAAKLEGVQPTPVGSMVVRASVARTFSLALGAGSHALKMSAHTTGRALVSPEGTGFSYTVIPAP